MHPNTLTIPPPCCVPPPIQLMRLALVCQEVALAHRGLDLPPGSAERLVALVALRAINGWSMQEVQEHWDAGSRQRGLLVEEAWGVDVSGA